jgi:hypothetical protein
MTIDIHSLIDILDSGLLFFVPLSINSASQTGKIYYKNHRHRKIYLLTYSSIATVQKANGFRSVAKVCVGMLYSSIGDGNSSKMAGRHLYLLGERLNNIAQEVKCS